MTASLHPLRRYGLVALLACLLATPAMAAGPLKRGWQEAVVNVSDIEAYTAFFEDIAGWEVISAGATDPALLSHWQLPDGASARYVLLGNPGTNSGHIRLMQFDGVPQRMIRAHTQSWDSGGIFDLNLRVKNMDHKREQLDALGWQAVSEPVQFAFGPFVVKEWIVRGPDGLTFALIERIAPELEGWPALREMSRSFNSTQIVRDMPAALAFYRDILGMEQYLYHRGASKKAGPNVLGLPHNLTTEIVREVIILHPLGVNEGSVELLAFEGLEGRRVDELARPPNLGLVMLRFPVASGLDALTARLDAGNIPYQRHNSISLPPHGQTTLISTRSPEGAWLEFYSSEP